MLLERRFLELRDQARRLEELLHRRVSSDEQREVLGLLCKVHELEMENMEIQSHALLKDSVIRQKNLVVQRFEQHRHLCDEIIQQQRQFIHGEIAWSLSRDPSLPRFSIQMLCCRLPSSGIVVHIVPLNPIIYWLVHIFTAAVCRWSGSSVGVLQTTDSWCLHACRSCTTST